MTGVLGYTTVLIVASLPAIPLGAALGFLASEDPVGPLSRLVRGVADVPPVIWGVVGLLAGTSALSSWSMAFFLLILGAVAPAVATAAAEVPGDVRATALALGADRYQVLVSAVLPAVWRHALATGLRSVGRALGDASPLLVVVAAAPAGTVPLAAHVVRAGGSEALSAALTLLTLVAACRVAAASLHLEDPA